MPRNARWVLTLALFLAAGVHPARAQQFVTDDAALTTRNSCQLEGWWGQRAVWLLPACQFIPRVEITPGVGWLADQPPERDNPDYVLQVKALFLDTATAPVGVGLVAGFGLDRLSQVVGLASPGFYAYVPLTVPAAGGRVLLHTNLGWRFEPGRSGEQRTEDLHAFTFGLRLDVQAIELLTLTAETYGDSTVPPEWQLGFSVVVIPDWLSGTFSYGTGFSAESTGAGFALGFAFTPPAFW